MQNKKNYTVNNYWFYIGPVAIIQIYISPHLGCNCWGRCSPHVCDYNTIYNLKFKFNDIIKINKAQKSWWGLLHYNMSLTSYQK